MAKSARALVSMLIVMSGLSGPLAIRAIAAGTDPSYYNVAKGSHPHDVAAAPGPGSPVYYTAQTTGKLGILDPKSSK